MWIFDCDLLKATDDRVSFFPKEIWTAKAPWWQQSSSKFSFVLGLAKRADDHEVDDRLSFVVMVETSEIDNSCHGNVPLGIEPGSSWMELPVRSF